MKWRVIILCFLLLLCVVLPSCKSQWHSPQLTMTVSSWSDWVPDYVPTVEEYAFDASPGFTISGKRMTSPSFSVVDVKDDEIHIHSDQPLSLRSESGTTNLLSEQQDFVIPFGESITLVTCSLDAGEIYTFTYTDRGYIS